MKKITLNEQINRARLLMGYDSEKTLFENEDIIFEGEEVIAEQLKNLLRTFSDDAIKLLGGEVKGMAMFGDDAVKATEFLKRARAGKAAAGELGTFTKGILKDTKMVKSNPGLFDDAVANYTKELMGSKSSLATQFQGASRADRAMLLKNAGYPEATINRILKQTDNLGATAAKSADDVAAGASKVPGKTSPTPGKTSPTPGKTSPTPGKVQAPGPGGQKLIDRWNKAKETVKNYKDDVLKKIQGLKGRLSPKQLALYGLAGYGAYELLFGDRGDEKGQDQVLGDCVANLPGVTFGIGTGDVAIAQIPDGVDEKSKGKGGLTFWPNGRVISGDLSVRGNYYCKGGAIKSAVAENQINEVDYNGVHIDWDGDKKTNPVPNPNPKPKYTPCTSFPMKFGCKSDKIREVQSCLEMPQEKQTGNFGPLTQKALTAKGYSGTELSEPDYLKILENCGKTTEPVKRINAEPIKLAPRDIKPAQINLSNLKLPDIKAPEVSDDVFYNALRSNGNIIGEDGNNRIKYKGPDLDELQIGKLDNVLKGMGYTRIKQLEDIKRYGSKYVWLKTQ
jgi:hypothetical protein